MSQENVDLIRNAYNAGDLLNLSREEIERAFRDYFDEHFEVRLPPDYPEGEPVFRGPQGVA